MDERSIDWYEGNWGSYDSQEDPEIDDGLTPLENLDFDDIVGHLNILSFNNGDGTISLVIPLHDNAKNFPFDLICWYWSSPDDMGWQEAEFETLSLELHGVQTDVASWNFDCNWGQGIHEFDTPELPINGTKIAIDFDWKIRHGLEDEEWKESLASYLATALANPREFPSLWEMCTEVEIKSEVKFPKVSQQPGSKDIVGITSSQTFTPNTHFSQDIFLRPMPNEQWICREALIASSGMKLSDSFLVENSCEEHRNRLESLFRFRSESQNRFFHGIDFDALEVNSRTSQIVERWKSGQLGMGRPRFWQVLAFEAWQNHGRHGVIEAATGSGKSHLGVIAALEALEENLAVVVVVPTLALQDQWIHIFAAKQIATDRLDGQHKNIPRRGRVLIAVQPSFREFMNRSENSLPAALLIADEVHNYGGHHASGILSPRFTRRLGLTATLIPTESNLALFYNYFGGPPVYVHSFEDAVDDGSITPFQLTIARCDMDGTAYYEYQKLREKLIACHEELVEKGVEQARERLTDAQLELLKVDEEFQEIAETISKLNAEIDRALSRLSSTSRAMNELAPLIKDLKGTLIFSDTTEACDEVMTDLRTFGVSIERITSKVTGRPRARILKNLGYGWIDAVVSPRVLDEGIDVQNVHTAIFVGGSRRKLQLIQRMGRALRISEGKHFAQIIFLVAKNSEDDPAQTSSTTPLKNSALKFIYDSSLKPVNVVDVDEEGELYRALGPKK